MWSIQCIAWVFVEEGEGRVKHLDSSLHLCLVFLPSLILKPMLYSVLFSILICSPILILGPILVLTPILILGPIPVLRFLCVNCVYAAGFGVQGGERLSHR